MKVSVPCAQANQIIPELEFEPTRAHSTVLRIADASDSDPWHLRVAQKTYGSYWYTGTLIILQR